MNLEWAETIRTVRRRARRGTWSALAALLLGAVLGAGPGGGCVTSRPPPGPLTPPPLVPATTPLAAANAIYNSLLMRSPLRDFAVRHRVALVRGAGPAAPELAAVEQALRLKLARARHVELVTDEAATVYRLELSVTANTDGTWQLRAVLRGRERDAPAVWTFTTTIARGPAVAPPPASSGKP